MNSKINNTKKALQNMQLKGVEVTKTNYTPDNGIVRNNFIDKWKMIYNLLTNIKTSMDATYQDNDGRITKQHVDDIVEYINMSLDNILGK